MNFFTVKNIIVYFIIINLLTFATMGIDKLKAKRGAWRIQEKTLFTLVFLGGGIGGIAGMKIFHHKTKKPAFQVLFPAITIAEICIMIYFSIKGF